MGSRFVPAVLLALLVVVHAQLWFGRGSISNVKQLQQKLELEKIQNAKAQLVNERLTAVGKASHQGTSVSVKCRSKHAIAGHNMAQARTAPSLLRRVKRLTCSAPPSPPRPRSHCSQPHSASSTKTICRPASPYSRLRQNKPKYSSELTIASGQPQCTSRMLQPTMVRASNTATSSSQLVSAPHAVKAVLSSHDHRPATTSTMDSGGLRARPMRPRGQM